MDEEISRVTGLFTTMSEMVMVKKIRKIKRSDEPYIIEILKPGDDCFDRYLKRGVANKFNKRFENVAARIMDEPGGVFWLTPLAGFMIRRGVKLQALYRSVNRPKLNRKSECDRSRVQK